MHAGRTNDDAAAGKCVVDRIKRFNVNARIGIDKTYDFAACDTRATVACGGDGALCDVCYFAATRGRDACRGITGIVIANNHFNCVGAAAIALLCGVHTIE